MLKGMAVILAVLFVQPALAVDLYGRYAGQDGFISIRRSPVNGVFVVGIEDRNGKCDMALDMKFTRGKLVCEDMPVTISFTKKGLVLDMPRGNLGEECVNFGLGKPFRRQ